MSIPKVLSIAGSAAQGSAGIQADLKTFQEFNVYGMSAITAIVANNKKTEQGIFTQPMDAVEAQIYASLEHVGVDAVKTGMLFTESIIRRVAEIIRESGVTNVVVDPVMIGKMGSQLLKDEAIDILTRELIPLAKIVTPNLHESARILNCEVPETPKDMKTVARDLYTLGADYVLVKGGSLKGYPAVDILFDGASLIELETERVDTIHTSGAGCTYSAAIASELANGYSVEEAVRRAKSFVTSAIRNALSFDRGIGSTYHAAHRVVK
ncbi:pyridoxine kinase/hydroxymethylpyrimidine/phosphomethylpyrimidine kinase [Halobacillus karajensis]|uniref:pyridoxal kinase n=1 Tax=Halobacillus karajensis TaxID=195088 RepID=A0A024P4S7_9BACI|nr:bifunctional hydroxymethylpyrimidine kinase/phosphomethylpyrimidine kinase [Halobacillus karajensis]CDQ18667.1 Pyridoxine kinase [Halobacillus karajensis]CDQ23261.1 Pyridoxine kinase [Halobacillus karajensis]CDQ26743.1 Pyridoxine kinase [Halobacillus karajensis]SEH48397.1 pyridoxine kinase/hydroxymethylpyrimidine/phosphomethylpyrimidine kinase [Halobacillus karajensis]